MVLSRYAIKGDDLRHHQCEGATYEISESYFYRALHTGFPFNADSLATFNLIVGVICFLDGVS